MEVPAKFIKLMMMTTSEHDGEALAALRKANALLAEANVNWEEFLALVGSASQSPPPPAKASSASAPWDDDFADVGKDARGHYTDALEINKLFEQAFRNTSPSSGFRDFLDSVHAFWEGNGFLTEKQYSAIRRSAARTRRRW